MSENKTVRCAVIGYGGAFNQGKAHALEISRVSGLELVAVCDLDPARAQAARQDFPQIQAFTRVEELLAEARPDFVAVVTPHNTHAPVALQCLRAGAGVIIEKPMCITTDEATQLIEEAKARGLLLTVFHNRRYDGDYLALKELVAQGLIGRIFKVEMFMGGYGKPGNWWRSRKEISGGIAYDWGAHYLDWLLDLMPGKIAELSGYIQQDLVWPDVSNEDHWESFIRFDDGAFAHLESSSVAAIGKPRWRILGTLGGVVSRDNHFEVRTQINGYWATVQVPYQKSTPGVIYDSIANYYLKGEPVAITPESARRVIGVIDWTERAVKAGRPLTPAFP